MTFPLESVKKVPKEVSGALVGPGWKAIVPWKGGSSIVFVVSTPGNTAISPKVLLPLTLATTELFKINWWESYDGVHILYFLGLEKSENDLLPNIVQSVAFAYLLLHKVTVCFNSTIDSRWTRFRDTIHSFFELNEIVVGYRMRLPIE